MTQSSFAKDRLAAARDAVDRTIADQLALEAIAADPDYGAAYAFRARIAASTGDPVRAAHYFRVAFTRGDRSPVTRYGLAVCLTAVGQGAIADRIREGHDAPADMFGFEDLVASMMPVIQQMLSAALPEKGRPALLPNERLPRASTPAPQVRAVRSQAPSAVPSPVPTVRVERSEPAQAEAERTTPQEPDDPLQTSEPPAASSPSAAPRHFTAPPTPKKVVRRAGREATPDWLQLTAPPRLEMETGDREDWVEDAANAVGAHDSDAIRIQAGTDGIELAYDPGVPQVPIRSPITGRLLTTQDLQDQFFNANMPQFGRRTDPMEARAEFHGEITDVHSLVVAVHLPGPVMTGPGMTPQKLCKRVAFGLTTTEVILRDSSSTSAAPVRLPLTVIDRLEVVGGLQVSLCLTDGRQVHLDLRELRKQSFVTAGEVLERLERAIGEG